MNDFGSLFSTFKKGNNFILLDPSLPIGIYYGLDTQNRYCVGVKTSFEVGAIESTKLLAISLAKGIDSWWTTIALTDVEAAEPFYAFCDDVISVATGAETEKVAYQRIVTRIACWRKMFGSIHSLLSEETIRGLFGELYFLKERMIPKYGEEKGESAWSGPLGTDKDFSIEKDWYEIKSVSVNGSSVKITSLEQLSSTDSGHLVLIRTERMAEGYDNGECSLNQLFKKISTALEAFPLSQKSFFEKCDKIGFAPNSAYDKYKFDVKEISSYFVNDQFPRLTKDILHSDAIVKVSYELSINSLKSFKEAENV